MLARGHIGHCCQAIGRWGLRIEAELHRISQPNNLSNRTFSSWRCASAAPRQEAADVSRRLADHIDVDSEVLVHQDVAEAPNLWPRDFRVRAGDLIGKVVHCFADDL